MTQTRPFLQVCRRLQVVPVAVLLALAGHAAFAGVGFSVAPIRAGDSPGDIAVGDFNRDGLPDLVVAQATGANPTVLLGHGDGSFEPPFDVLATVFATGVEIGDLNDDGLQDLVMFDYAVGVAVGLGHGDGTFGPAIRTRVLQRPHDFVVADFDADGRDDVAVTEIQDSGAGISILLGLGDGTFASGTRLRTVDLAFGLAVGDFNGDDVPDLAATSRQPSSVLVIPGLGDGTFAPPAAHSTGGGPIRIGVGDFNTDGNEDVAVVNDTSRDVSVLLGRGDGTFGPESRLRAGDLPNSVIAGDFDADGVQDLAVGDHLSSGIFVFPSIGNGAFGEPAFFEVGAIPYGTAVGDLDLDGREDLAVGRLRMDSLALLLNQGPFPAPDRLAGPPRGIEHLLGGAVVTALPSGVQMRITGPDMEIPAGTTGAVAVFMFGRQVTAGTDGIEGTADDLDLRGTFMATTNGAPLTPRLLEPNGASVRVPIRGDVNSIVAAVSGIVAGTRERARDIDFLVLTRAE